MTAMRTLPSVLLLVALALGAPACVQGSPEGLAVAPGGSGPQVRFDLFARPLPEIPLPNDLATRADPGSPTGLRLNASQIAPTAMESTSRRLMDELDGWGTYAPITIPFTAPLDPQVILERHRDRYDFSNDAVLVIDITPDSPDFGQAVPLDLGEGNFPVVMQRQRLFVDDPRGDTQSLLFEEHDEDLNGDGVLQPGEDTDSDAVLDRPNLLPGATDPVDGLMTFYERETNTLILRPLLPLREETRYAVVVTRRLRGADGQEVRSPFRFINHAQQTEALRPLVEVLPSFGLTLGDVAFTWAFTTQSITRPFRVIRDGLYGSGPLARLHDEYPAQLETLHRLKDAASGAELYLVRSEEWVPVLEQIAQQLLNLQPGDPVYDNLLESQRYVDYHVFGTFVSPQFFPRLGRRDPATGELVPVQAAKPDDDPEAELLPLNEQSWRLDPQTGAAFVRPERVTFWMVVPRPEVAPRPAPVAIIGHGYTGAKLDPLNFGGFFAQHGIALVSIECASHGVELSPMEEAVVHGLFAQHGLGGMAEAVLTDRAFDQNGDGSKDSGADFWTAYMFHTRDVVRQSAVDYLQLIRLLRSFDGTRRWPWDTNGDGQPDLAGDFDGDGVVDVGGPGVTLSMTGASLGGIMSAIMAGIEPELAAAVPISGGAGLLDIGIRSIQGGVPEAVVLRLMGPLFFPQRSEAGVLELHQMVPDRNKRGDVAVAPLDEVAPDDTIVVENLDNGEVGCARAAADGFFRAAVPADQDARLRVSVYAGMQLTGKERCAVRVGAAPRQVIDTFGAKVVFQARTHAAGAPLVALGDGLGLRRATPELRRMMALSQVVLDPGDPANFAPYYERWSLTYADGSSPRPRVLVLATDGDQNVPVNTGIAIGRIAGFVNLTREDPRYGRTPNEVLLDTYTIEGAPRLQRHVDAEGNGVVMDVENLCEGTDGFDVPRLDPPLRLVGSSANGGLSGLLVPFIVPGGKHGFDAPGAVTPAGFDTGRYLVNLLGRYLATGGNEVVFDQCLGRNDCAFVPPLPPTR